MADIGTFVTNMENILRDIKSNVKRVEELSADMKEQYDNLGGNTTTNAWFDLNPDAKEYTKDEFSAAVGKLTIFSNIIPEADDQVIIKVTGYTPRKG